jgi:hypothetical protein
MPNDITFVQIEPNEEAVSVRDRLSFLRGQQVLLIWPEEGTALNRKLDLVLVQREAMRRAVRLALVTHDTHVMEHAKDLNISTFETIGAAQRGRWKRGRSKVFTSRDDKPEETPDSEALMDVASRVRGTRRLPTFRWTTTVIMLALLAAAAGLAIVIAPGATVTLVLAEETVEVTQEIIASLDATTTNVEAGIIPARLRRIEIEESADRPTSGFQSLPPSNSNGTVLFINQSDEAITIPAGTVVSTSDSNPVRFETTIDATLSAGSGQRVEVGIQALASSAGSQGNVAAGLITTVEAEWNDQVTVANQIPTSGGQDNTVRIVTEEDRERLLAALRQQLQARALTTFEAQLADNEMLIADTIGIAPEGEREDWKTYSQQVGQAADSVRLSMRAIVQVVVVDQQRGEEIVFARMGQQIPRGRQILPESVEYLNGPVTEVRENGDVVFSMTGTGRVTGRVSAAQVQEGLVGKTLEEAQAYLLSAVDLQPGTTPDIIVEPDLLGRMPLLPMRIQVNLVETGS